MIICWTTILYLQMITSVITVVSYHTSWTLELFKTPRWILFLWRFINTPPKKIRCAKPTSFESTTIVITPKSEIHRSYLTINSDHDSKKCDFVTHKLIIFWARLCHVRDPQNWFEKKIGFQIALELYRRSRKWRKVTEKSIYFNLSNKPPPSPSKSPPPPHLVIDIGLLWLPLQIKF